MKIIPAEGPKNAKIVFVGEAGGVEEERLGRPFVGPAGQELDRELERAGINRKDCYITNVVKHRLNKNDFGVMYLDKKCTKPTPELEECWKELEDELRGVGCNVIIPLGGFALDAVCGIRGIGKWRGSCIASKWGAKCIPTYHPSGVLRAYELRPIVIRDLQKAKRESWHPLITRPKREFIIRPDMQQIQDYFEKIKEVGKCAVDIETTYHKTISCIGFSCEKSSAICIPFRDEFGERWNPDQRGVLDRMINEILSDSKIEKYGQNFAYDMAFLKRDGFEINNFAFDSLVAHHSIYPELPKDLGFLASLYTNEPYWKDDGKDWRKVSDWDRYFKYNATDAAVTFELVAPLKSLIQSEGVQGTFDFEMSLVPRFVNATLRGIKYNTIWRDELKKDRRKKIKELVKDFASILPESWVCSKFSYTSEETQSRPVAAEAE